MAVLQNVKLVMMDAGGRDILSLERMENGKMQELKGGKSNEEK